MDKFLLYTIATLGVIAVVLALIALQAWILVWVVNTLVPFVFPTSTIHINLAQGLALLAILTVFGSFFKGSSSSK